MSLLTLLLLLPQDDWWNRDWEARRPVTVVNRQKNAALEAGQQIHLTLDLGYLGLKSKADLADLVVTHRNRPIPCYPERVEDKVHLWFRVPSDIPADSRDDAFTLYYGNPSAPDPTDRNRVFDLCWSSSHPDWALPKRLDGIEATLAAGVLVVSNLAEVSARIPLDASVLSRPFVMELEFSPERNVNRSLSTGVRIGLKTTEDPADLKETIDRLLELLGSENWEDRDRATREWIAIGPPALPHLEPLLQSEDAELRIRSRTIVQQIRGQSESRSIAASVWTELKGEAPAFTAQFHYRIEQATGGRLLTPPAPDTYRIRIERNRTGETSIFCNDTPFARTIARGDVDSFELTFTKNTLKPAAAVRIERLRVWRHLDEGARPTIEIGVEEKRP